MKEQFVISDLSNYNTIRLPKCDDFPFRAIKTLCSDLQYKDEHYDLKVVHTSCHRSTRGGLYNQYIFEDRKHNKYYSVSVASFDGIESGGIDLDKILIKCQIMQKRVTSVVKYVPVDR